MFDEDSSLKSVQWILFILETPHCRRDMKQACLWRFEHFRLSHRLQCYNCPTMAIVISGWLSITVDDSSWKSGDRSADSPLKWKSINWVIPKFSKVFSNQTTSGRFEPKQNFLFSIELALSSSLPSDTQVILWFRSITIGDDHRKAPASSHLWHHTKQLTLSQVVSCQFTE